MCSRRIFMQHTPDFGPHYRFIALVKLLIPWFLVVHLPAFGGTTFKGWDFNHQCLTTLEDIEQTLFSCNVALRITKKFASDPPTTAQTEQLASLRLARANALFFSGDIDASIENYQRAIDLNDWRASAFAGLGRSLYIKGSDQAATRALNQAIALFPDYGLAFRYRGLVALRSGQTQAAITDLHVPVRLNTSVADNHVLLGIAQIMHGDRAAARQSFDKAADLLLGWDYLELWRYLASNTEFSGRRLLKKHIDELEFQWPSALLLSFIDVNARQQLLNQLLLPEAETELSQEQFNAAVFYLSLLHESDPELAADWLSQNQNFDSRPRGEWALTIEHQLLPAVTSGTLPNKTSGSQ